MLPLAEPNPTIDVIRITNPLNPNEHVTHQLAWNHTMTVGDLLKAYELEGEWVVGLNGAVVEKDNYDLTRFSIDDSVVLYPVPEGGGGGKNILRIVALVALTVVTAGVGTAMAAAGYSAFAVGMSQAGIMIAGSMLINALLPPPKPSFNANGNGLDDSPSYGIDGAKNTSAEGLPVPIVYGTYRVGGNIINTHVENVDNTQFLYMLLNLGEGPVESIGDIMINDQPIDNFKDATIYRALGNDVQEPPEWFDDTVRPYQVGQKMTTDWILYDTQDEVDKLRVDVVFPQGIFRVRDDGSYVGRTIDLELQYRRVGDVDWTPLGARSEIIGYEHWCVYDSGNEYQNDLGEGGILNPNAPYIDPQYIIDHGLGSKYDGRPILQSIGPNPVCDDCGDLYETIGYYDYRPIYSDVSRVSTKSRSAVRRSFVSGRLPEGMYQVRARRIDEESTSARIADSCTLSDINEIVIDDVSYRHTALLGLRIKLSDQLNSLPKVTSLMNGRIVPIYDLQGNYVADIFSRNPAWITLDALTHTRYGGAIALERIDLGKWAEWARYCDEFGLTFDGTLDTQSNLWDALQPVFRAGHGQIVNIGTKYSITVERADDPVMMFSVANIVEGSFSNSWLPMNDRANAIELSYFEKEDNYRRHTVKVYDKSRDPNEPERVSNITMIGVTDAERATKEALFHLNLNRYIQQSVQFEAPIEAIACTVGDLIYVQHDMPQWGFAGKLKNNNTTAILNLDREITMESGKDYIFLAQFDAIQRTIGSVVGIAADTLTLSGFDIATPVKRIKVAGKDMRVLSYFNGGVVVESTAGINIGDTYTLWDIDVIEERQVVTEEGTHTQITLQSPLSEAPASYTNFMFGENGKVKKPFRITSIGGTHEYTRTIGAVEYNESVYDLTLDEAVQTPVYSSLNAAPDHVTITEVTEELFLVGSAIRTRVTIHYSSDYDTYKTARVYVSSDGGEFASEGIGRDSFSFEADDGAELLIRVVAIDMAGSEAPFSSAPEIAHTVVGKAAPPSNVTGLSIARTTGGLSLSWDAVSDLDLSGYQIRMGASWDSASIVTSKIQGTTMFVPITEPGDYIYHIRSIDTSGNFSEGTASTSIDIARPGHPEGFDCIQNGDLINFRWGEPNSVGILAYEIREGESWETAIPVRKVSGDATQIPADITGERTFWAKTVDEIGLYSVLSVFSVTTVASPPDRNVIFTRDFEALNYPGVLYNLYQTGSDLILSDSKQYGEYIAEVDLGDQFRARNLLSYVVRSSVNNNLTWADATFAWADPEANQQWVPDGDLNSIDATPYISRFVGLGLDYVDGFSLNNTLDGINGTLPSLSANLTYQDGRFADGLFVGDTTQAAWGISVPQEFKVHFWVNIQNAVDDCLYIKMTSVGGNLMTVTYSQLTNEFVLTDNLAQEVRVPFTIAVNDRLLIAIVQTATERKLMIGNGDGTQSFSTESYTPVGSFDNVQLHQ